MKLKITKYQETLNGKPIDGYFTQFMLEGTGEWQSIQDVKQWRRWPSAIFEKYNHNAHIGTIIIFPGR